MESSNLRQQLHKYIDDADDKLLKLMYAIAKEYNEDDDFVSEIDRRTTELESGKVKGYNWDQVKQSARSSIKPKKGE